MFFHFFSKLRHPCAFSNVPQESPHFSLGSVLLCRSFLKNQPSLHIFECSIRFSTFFWIMYVFGSKNKWKLLAKQVEKTLHRVWGTEGNLVVFNSFLAISRKLSILAHFWNHHWKTHVELYKFNFKIVISQNWGILAHFWKSHMKENAAF